MDAYSTDRADVDYSDRPPVIIVASGAAALARARNSVEACGARIGATLGLAEACGRLGLQPAVRAVWVELDEQCGHEIDELLSLIARDSLNERYGSVVSIAPRLIDPAIAILGESPVQLLIDPDDAERAAAFALATSQLAIPLSAHDIASDRSAERLRQLSDEVGRIASTLARLSAGPSIPATPITKPADGEAPAVTAETVRSIIRARRLRARFFREDLFADPAWDMLLDLLQAELSHLRVPVSSLCIAAAVPATTALRWLKTMVQQGLFVRRADPHDGRRVFVELAPEASRALHNYFAEVGAIAGI